ncbi:putative kinesin [Periconia macrospinosa]|uniref:Putative kinesin n=1 Tax=Periconia macrospinosa TaxID=97972 RepID=A0A2V1D4B5_9PLEO|nr:putative kinesin [Periconia macrospinosa]
MPPINNNGNISNFAQRDINIGTQNNNYHPERPETPPRPSAVIPFSQDTDFVKRGAILDEVDRRYVVPGTWAALVGLGGVGKSQLAIEYAYQRRIQSPDTWVLWVYASNAVRFQESYREIANRAKISGRKDPNADIFQLVHDWLCNSKDQWLLVLDNVDDASFLLDAPKAQPDDAPDSRSAPKPLRSYIPHSEHGSVLVTSRNQEAALQLVEQRDCITVKPMDEDQARTLLDKKLLNQEDADRIHIDELAKALEYMPLAIVQAAAYITRKKPRCSVQEYLLDFQKSDSERTALLNNEAGHLRRDHEAKSSIIITWHISFDHIRKTRPSAGNLLSLMSFFDRQGIPQELLRAQPGKGPAQQEQHERDSKRQALEDEGGTSQSNVGDDGFEDDVRMLRDYSFISATDRTSFEMHRLVQLATRDWLHIRNELEQWKHHFIRNLCDAFPTAHYENWRVCQKLFAHAKSAAEQRPEREDSLVHWAFLLYNVAAYALVVGNWAEAEAMSLESTKTQTKILGVGHEYTLRSIVILARTYTTQNRLLEAEKLQVQTCKKKFRADDKITLGIIADLALTYWIQGRLPEAEKLQVQVMETYKKKLGADHSLTLQSMKILAVTLKSRGFTSEAISLLKDCCELSSRVSPQHPDLMLYRETLRKWQLKAREIQDQRES